MVFLYITCKDAAEAKHIGHALVKSKAAGCVNIAPIHSIFRENGETKEVTEASLLVKTVDAKVQQVENLVRELHSYKVPCIAAFALHRLNREYKEWLVGAVS